MNLGNSQNISSKTKAIFNKTMPGLNNSNTLLSRDKSKEKSPLRVMTKSTIQ